MREEREHLFNVKSLVPPPGGLLPRSTSRSVFDKYWSIIVPKTLSPARPTVTNPASFPFGSVALLNFYDDVTPAPNFLGDATGFFFKPDLLLTAAHNLAYSQATTVAIFPGWDSKLHASPVLAGLRWCQSVARDVSVIVTQAAAPMSVTLGGTPSAMATLVGYAFDYPDGSRRMSMGTGTAHLQGREYTYEIAAQQRDSGAPVFSAVNQVMALHKEALPGPDGTMIGGGEAVDAELIAIVAQLETQARSR